MTWHRYFKAGLLDNLVPCLDGHGDEWFVFVRVMVLSAGDGCYHFVNTF